jgi:4-hydroxysphinganine ceramide fatty acyl 2-hydroxylase
VFVDRIDLVLTTAIDWEATDDFHPEDTDAQRDYEKNQFLDLRKPLLRQVWEANFSKSYYLQQVHQPRHTGASSPRLFGPNILEVAAFSPCHIYYVTHSSV